MKTDLEARSPAGSLYRLGRHPDPWQFAPWELAGPDGTFSNRFDDPEGYYRVLYAASQRLACFMETLARYRPDLELIAELDEIEGPNDFLPLGTVPRDWLEKRLMGSAAVEGQFADIYAAGWVSYLRTRLAGQALKLGMADIDLASLQTPEPRRLTQLASREAYFMNVTGIFYRSRYGHSLENWALFEPATLLDEDARDISEDDPDLLEAMRLHGVELEA